MTNISFKGFNHQTVTFHTKRFVSEGFPADIDGDGDIVDSNPNGKFIGIICNSRNGIACVQLEGYVELPYSGAEPGYGYTPLVADGIGGVSVSEDENTKKYRVIKVDTDNSIIGFILS